MVAFEWTTDVWAPASIAVLGALIGTLVAVFFARRTAMRAIADQRGLALDLVRLERELDAIDRLDQELLSLRDAISNWEMSFGDETVAAAAGAPAVRDEFFHFTRTCESLHVRLRPELRTVVVPFAQSTEWVGGLRAEAELLDGIRKVAPPDDPSRTKALDGARSEANELLERVRKMRKDLHAAVDLYV